MASVSNGGMMVEVKQNRSNTNNPGTDTGAADLSGSLFGSSGSTSQTTSEIDKQRQLLARASPPQSDTGAGLRNKTDKTYADTVKAVNDRMNTGDLTRTMGNDLIQQLNRGEVTNAQVLKITDQAAEIRDAKWMEQRYEEGGIKLLLACNSKEAYERMKASGELNEILADKALATARKFQQKLSDEVAQAELVTKDIARALANQGKQSDRAKSVTGEAPLNSLNGALAQLSQDHEKNERKNRDSDVNNGATGSGTTFMTSTATESVLRTNEANLQASGIDRPQVQLVREDTLRAEIDKKLLNIKKETV